VPILTHRDYRRTDWADDGEEDQTPSLPAPEVIKNSNGTETHISYRLREDGKKVKTTRIIRRSVIKATVNPRVAERRAWAKFGASAKDGQGPQSDTTTVGEDIQLNPRQGFKSGDAAEKEQVGAVELEKQSKMKNATVKCRICNGDHFTARCPFKGTMAPEGDPGTGLPPAEDMMAETTGTASSGVKGSYVPPALRKGAGASVGEKMGGGKYERDDLATLRVTNVSNISQAGAVTITDQSSGVRVRRRGRAS
jgi:translation initiation factor 3 subunit G